MNEERWHNFAKEKPSEDMEGRNFIVSNGHYEKIATWCGYWENEPFMGACLCDEVVRWKFYFTPEEEEANKLEDVKATAYAESVDSGMENYRLSKALWLARAERASDKARIFYFAETCGVKLNIDGYSNKEKGHTRMCTARWWRLTWLKVERKCRVKAEEYK